MLSRSVMEYFSRVSKPLICDLIVLSSDSLRFCFICSLSSSESFSFFTFSWFNIFSSHRRAFALRSLAPPEITPDFWNKVPSNDTDYNRHEQASLVTAVATSLTKASLSQKCCEIEPRLPYYHELATNSLWSHKQFQLTPKSTKLNDLDWLYCTLLHLSNITTEIRKRQTRTISSKTVTHGLHQGSC